MSEIQELEVEIAPDGTVSIHVKGAKGEKCLDLTGALEQLLGGNVIERELTDEFHEQDERQMLEGREN